jgi:hypothetical protein
MLRKLSFVLSAVAALGLAVAVTGTADAQTNHKKNVHVNKTVHVNRTVNVHRNVRVNRAGPNRSRYVIGHSYNGHMWYGQNRHRWHGRWYAYGDGPCWVNVDGLWFWNVVACP